MEDLNIWRITLDTNPEDCNLNCIMCEEHSHYSNFKKQLFEKKGIKYRRMPSTWIYKIFEEASRLGIKEIIPSTMGEPLLYKDIDLFFELAEKYNIKINLTTNGTFPKKSVTEWAKMIIPVTSDTKISLNGATKHTAEKIMIGLNFDNQVQNIKKPIDEYLITHENGDELAIIYISPYQAKNSKKAPKGLQQVSPLL